MVKFKFDPIFKISFKVIDCANEVMANITHIVRGEVSEALLPLAIPHQDRVFCEDNFLELALLSYSSIRIVQRELLTLTTRPAPLAGISILQEIVGFGKISMAFSGHSIKKIPE